MKNDVKAKIEDNKKKQNQETDKTTKFLTSTVFPILEIIFIIVILRGYVLEAFQVPTGSMIDTILEGDFLLVEKVTYKFENPTIGDVVVFKYPVNEKLRFVKRCIAVEGDTVELKDKVLYVNGKKSIYQGTQHIAPEIIPAHPSAMNNPEIYQREWEKRKLADYLAYTIRDNFGPVTVPKGTIFCMGDNRDNSSDCRFWGPVPLKNVTGRPLFIYLSTSLIDKIPDTERQNLTMLDNIFIMLKSIIQFWNIRYDRIFNIIR